MSGFRWTREHLGAALGELLLEGIESVPLEGFAGVSTDTRSIGAGDLFVALIGDRFDAHRFLHDAVAAGAAGVLVSEANAGAPDGASMLRVTDTLAALGRLGRHRRRQLDARVLGITGTNGKTTTKDIARAVLSSRFRVHATAGNLNNQIGVPLTLLAAPGDAEVLVVEMGTNEPGEIEILARIAEPDAAVITAVGEGHLEKLGSVEGVLVEKTALVAGLPQDGSAYVAELPPSLPVRARALLPGGRVRVAGFGPDADLAPEGGGDGIEVLPDGSTRWRWRDTEFHLPLRGRHNVRNALLALGVAAEWGISPADAAAALESMPAPKLRGEWRHIGDTLLIADCYNANPPSMAAAVELLAGLPSAGPKLLVVGSMRELGTESERLHREAAASISRLLGKGIDRVLATGDFVHAFRQLSDVPAERLIAHEDPVAAWEMIVPSLAGNETVLLKASRGEALERLIPLLESARGA